MRTMAPRALVRPALATFVAAAGFALAGCGENVEPTAPPSPPAPPSAEPSPAALDWTRSTCQALDPIFGPPPEVDLTDADATRQAYRNYVADAHTATEQALDRLQSLGAPPVKNGQQALDDLRAQLTDLRTDLADARSRLDQADPNDAAAIGDAMLAAGNMVGSLGNSGQVRAVLEANEQLDAATEQTPECEDLAASDETTTGSSPTSEPTTGSSPTS